jgi:geranylgeranyl reductase
VFDLAIVGAGPAGATLARLIGQKWRVLLLDRRPLGSARREGSDTKCCGGLLAPDAQRMLGVLGLGLPTEVLEEPQVFLVRAIDLPSGTQRCYQRHYINVDREAFDRWLLSQVPGAVDMRLGCRLVSCEREGEDFRLGLWQDGRASSEQARAVVGADGAGSCVRRLLAPPARPAEVYVAVQEWFEARDPLPYFCAIFDPEVTDYYSWTIPKRGALLVGSALRRGRGCRARFDLLKRRLGQLGFSLARRVRSQTGLLLRPGGPRRICTGRGRVALIGEAAGWISPSSAEGLSYAFRSAIAMADALRGGLDGFVRRYTGATRALRCNILWKSAKAHLIYDPWLRRAIMRSGIGSVAVAR